MQVKGDATPLIETSSNAINTTIDMKQIEDLPLAAAISRRLSQLTAGYNGTWNGLPAAAQSNTVDGIVGNTNRWRYQSVNTARTPPSRRGWKTSPRWSSAPIRST